MRVLSIRHRILLPVTTVFCLVALGLPTAVSDEPESPPNPAVETSPPNPGREVLRGLDRASYLHLDAALRFACREKILERSPGWKQSNTFDYMYVYDAQHGFQDYRTLRRKGSSEPVDPAGLGVKRFLARGTMWTLIFNRTRQAKFRYQWLGVESMHGIEAAKIGFEPVPPYEESINDWFGTAWVDPTSYQLLRVEAMKAGDHERWEQVSEALRKGISQTAFAPGSNTRINRVTTDFEILKNGMRFPSRVKILSTVYYLPSYGSAPRLHELLEESSTQTYTDYRFYGVRTSEEVRNVLKPSRSRR